MDPTQTLADLLTAVQDGDIELARELLAALSEWQELESLSCAPVGFSPNFDNAWALHANRVGE